MQATNTVNVLLIMSCLRPELYFSLVVEYLQYDITYHFTMAVLIHQEMTSLNMAIEIPVIVGRYAFFQAVVTLQPSQSRCAYL